MSHIAISIALHADIRSSDVRRMAKSSNTTCAVWRILNALRPIMYFASVCSRWSMTGSFPGVT
jgi:hypothetical protein